MATTVPTRSARIAYLAGLVVIVGLMAFIALGGSVITSKKPTIHVAPPTVPVLHQE